MIDAAEAAERLIGEADRCRGLAAHYTEQQETGKAEHYLLLEYGLRLVAHVWQATDDEAGA